MIRPTAENRPPALYPHDKFSENGRCEGRNYRQGYASASQEGEP